MSRKYVKEMLKMIDKSPTAYHVIANVKNILDEAGFTALDEAEAWDIQAGEKYYVTRNDSSLIAFTVPRAASACAISARLSKNTAVCFLHLGLTVHFLLQAEYLSEMEKESDLYLLI